MCGLEARFTDGSSAVWPEINIDFLSLQGVSADRIAGSEIQSVYKNLLLGLDVIASCEIKDFYRFKLYLRGLDQNDVELLEIRPLIRAFLEWVSFDYESARLSLRQYISEHPTDVMTLFFLHMLDFSTGKTASLMPVLDYCDVYLDERHPLFAFYLSIKSFVLCENQRYDESLAAGLDSVRLCPFNIYGIHAVAHALHEKGCWSQVCEFLEGCKENWLHNPGMRMHVYWHLAVAYERLGETGKSVTAFRELYILKDSRFAKQDLDAVSFLWRWRLKKPSDRQFDAVWQDMAALWAGCIGTSLSYFHKLHAALVFVAARQPLLLEKLIAESDGFGVEYATHVVGMEVLDSILLFSVGRYAECASRLRACEDRWFLIGGSYAQRELLALTADEAQGQSSAAICA